jgi:ATP-binding cassette subfamily F protein uup
VGGYDDWVRQREPDPRINAEKPPVTPANQRPKGQSKPKLSYKERRELEELPEAIEILEAEQKELYRSLSDPEFYQKKGAGAAATLVRLKTIEEQLDETYRRWEFLDSKEGNR